MAVTPAVDIEHSDNYIGGEWRPGGDGGRRELIDPATGEVFADVAEGTPADVDSAVDAAWAAYHGEWGGWGPRRRSQLLLEVARRIRADYKKLGRIESLEVGKRLAAGEGEALGAADTFEYFGTLARHIHGSTVPSDESWDQWTTREPYGAVGQIVPWNFPISMASWKLAPALAAGNACVLKPSENTPLTALYLASLFSELGAPPGVVNVVMGAGEVVGAALASHPNLERIAFTGGTETGRSILRLGADSIKKVTLELGGKSPNIIFADAEWAPAMQGALAGFLRNSGQVCDCGSRLYVQRPIYDRFLDEMAARSHKIRVGPGSDPRTQVAPLHSAAQLERVEQYVAIGQQEGARLLVGGGRPSNRDRGFYLEPTIFVDCQPTMRIVSEEIFGPVLSVMPFDKEEEAIAAANASSYGLAAGIWTSDLTRAHRLIRSISAGMVWVNMYGPSPDELPWGGYRQSGIGRGSSTHGVEEYLQTKSVILNRNPSPTWDFGD